MRCELATKKVKEGLREEKPEEYAAAATSKTKVMLLLLFPLILPAAAASIASMGEQDAHAQGLGSDS